MASDYSTVSWQIKTFPQKVSAESIFFFNSKIVENSNTVFPRIVSSETILFWNLECGNYSGEETIQGRKLDEEIW